MRRDDRLADRFALLVAVLIVLNRIVAVGFALALLASFPLGGIIEARLAAKYGSALDPATLADWLRLSVVLGLVAAAAVDRLFVALRAIVATVSERDPFVAANAARLRRIGWALLVLQLLDLAEGALAHLMRRMGAQALTWTPSFTGWIAVLVAFVLAQVFARGAAMRADLDGTL